MRFFCEILSYVQDEGIEETKREYLSQCIYSVRREIQGRSNPESRRHGVKAVDLDVQTIFD